MSRRRRLRRLSGVGIFGVESGREGERRMPCARRTHDGTGRDGTGWDGMEWNGMGWDVGGIPVVSSSRRLSPGGAAAAISRLAVCVGGRVSWFRVFVCVWVHMDG